MLKLFSELVPIEFKSGPSYVKHTIILKNGMVSIGDKVTIMYLTFFDWRGETSEVFVVRTAANLLAILLLAANFFAANLLKNIC